jgi:hypothetical protein
VESKPHDASRTVDGQVPCPERPMSRMVASGQFGIFVAGFHAGSITVFCEFDVVAPPGVTRARCEPCRRGCTHR